MKEDRTGFTQVAKNDGRFWQIVWVIQLKSARRFFGYNWVTGQIEWVRDPNEACQFVRRVDGERMADLFDFKDVVITQEKVDADPFDVHPQPPYEVQPRKVTVPWYKRLFR